MAECLTLKKSNCKNCYKCIRNCPVKSIRFSGNQAHIIGDECILCGRCFVVCPQNAKQVVNETEKVRVLLLSGDPVYVSLAPSFIANYDGVGIEGMREALMQLGFAGVEETAIGATMVKREYERILKEGDRQVVISSCCHSVNLLIQKYFPNLLPYLADVMTPMAAHCQDIKKRIPNAKTVFIGPCVAKKDEAAQSNGLVDAVLTFEELTAWLKKERIELKKDSYEKEGLARFFPTTGGILKSFTEKNDDYTYLSVDGTENCILVLKDIEAGNVPKIFIEMSACVGSCIGGPLMEKNLAPLKRYADVIHYAGDGDLDVPETGEHEIRHEYSFISRSTRMPSEEEIRDILAQMGKTKPEHELNCGSCGYNSCREKAIAIYNGKADVSMCLPYLKEKAESFSDIISKSSPNGIIVLNDRLEVQQINRAAMRILNLRSENMILGDHIVRVMDPDNFLQVQETGIAIYDVPVYLAEYNAYVEQTIVPDPDSNLMVCLLKDITAEQDNREKEEEMRRQTIEAADKVVDKQMRIVQEIASLLGETAAETKITLAKLKESISHE